MTDKEVIGPDGLGRIANVITALVPFVSAVVKRCWASSSVVQLSCSYIVILAFYLSNLNQGFLPRARIFKSFLCSSQSKAFREKSQYRVICQSVECFYTIGHMLPVADEPEG